jgi:3-phosphoshikimate 1-carboxyvinyltransferase
MKGLRVSEHGEVLPTTLTVEPLSGALDAVVRVPGSKSITNRALLCAALAQGQSVLSGALLADDSFAMVGAIRGLGATVHVDEQTSTIRVTGAPLDDGGDVTIDARQSGTTSRFILPAAALRTGPLSLMALSSSARARSVLSSRPARAGRRP